jgi:hypothetical protein
MRPPALCNLLLVTELLLLAGGQAASAQQLRGRVEDASSRSSIAVVEVVLLAQSGRVLARTQTDSAGVFVFVWRGSDQVRLEARRIGFETTTTAFFAVEPDEVLTASVLLSAKPITIDPLIITSRSRIDEALSYAAGIERRRRGGIGHFITRDQIRASSFSEIAQILRTVPGVTLRADQSSNALFAFSSSNASTGMSTAAGRGRGSGTAACPMTIFLNGRIHRNPLEGVNLLAAFEVEAIEVYRNMTEVPSEFSGSHARCGVIAIWSARRL